MPTVRSLVLHLAIAVAATVMVAAAAVAIGMSGSHSFGGQIESGDTVHLATSDWPSDIARALPAPIRGIADPLKVN